MGPFEATYWNQLQVLIWICTRKVTWVRRAADVSRDPHLLIYQATLNGTVLSFEDAENDAISKLGSGKLRTWALRNGTGDPEEITSDQWGHLRFYFEPRSCAAPRDLLRPDSTHWTQLTFRREDVLALWRNPFEATAYDHPMRPGASEPLLPAEDADRQEIQAEHATSPNHIRRRGRKPGHSSYADTDAPLVEKMRQMVMNGEAYSAWHAALAVVSQAAGSGKDESKAKRLLGRYSEKFSAEIS